MAAPGPAAAGAAPGVHATLDQIRDLSRDLNQLKKRVADDIKDHQSDLRLGADVPPALQEVVEKRERLRKAVDEAIVKWREKAGLAFAFHTSTPPGGPSNNPNQGQPVPIEVYNEFRNLATALLAAQDELEQAFNNAPFRGPPEQSGPAGGSGKPRRKRGGRLPANQPPNVPPPAPAIAQAVAAHMQAQQQQHQQAQAAAQAQMQAGMPMALPLPLGLPPHLAALQAAVQQAVAAQQRGRKRRYSQLQGGAKRRRGKLVGEGIADDIRSAFDPNKIKEGFDRFGQQTKEGFERFGQQTKTAFENAFDPNKNGLAQSVAQTAEAFKNVNWQEVGQHLGDALDPQKNGVSAAFEKFGGDAKRAFEDLGQKIKDSAARDKAALDQAFAPLVNEFQNPNSLLSKWATQAGIPLTPEQWKAKFEDPETYFTLLSVLVTAAAGVTTAGAASPMVFAAMQALINSARVITKAAQGEPVTAMDIGSVVIALVPGVTSTGGTDPTSWLNAATMIGKSIAKDYVEDAAKNFISANIEERREFNGRTLAALSTEAEMRAPQNASNETPAQRQQRLVNQQLDATNLAAQKADEAWKASGGVERARAEAEQYILYGPAEDGSSRPMTKEEFEAYHGPGATMLSVYPELAGTPGYPAQAPPAAPPPPAAAPAAAASAISPNLLAAERAPWENEDGSINEEYMAYTERLRLAQEAEDMQGSGKPHRPRVGSGHPFRFMRNTAGLDPFFFESSPAAMRGSGFLSNLANRDGLLRKTILPKAAEYAGYIATVQPELAPAAAAVKALNAGSQFASARGYGKPDVSKKVADLKADLAREIAEHKRLDAETDSISNNIRANSLRLRNGGLNAQQAGELSNKILGDRNRLEALEAELLSRAEQVQSKQDLLDAAEAELRALR